MASRPGLTASSATLPRCGSNPGRSSPAGTCAGSGAPGRRGVFAGWYLNLEEPYTRHHDEVRTTDHVLDIVVTPQRRWEWKDADEFDRRIGHPLYFDKATARTIRSTGEQLIRAIEAADFPFDGTHTGFRPDPTWPVPRLTGGRA
ncbi:DUF402 domain-containing protein [Paractinoplanes rishiriensis]|uniref:DUF402 domain-containing protein n=1 Tax=Paractinoplanes rishiriensis TaxID=1050105 RepID=A0A919K3C9_9ACTN|nr:DUF402 domain-containing protein [Actinoplanes rishiriensis]GIE98774.1 hypothetical protein Ari01nite_62390 [Actinoplanes rishiriensis]